MVKFGGHFKEEDTNVHFPIAPPPHWSGAKWGNPGNRHEQFIFFTYKGIYTQSDLALVLLDLEEDFLKIS